MTYFVESEDCGNGQSPSGGPSFASPLTQASPWRVFPTLDEYGLQGIPLQVSHHRMEMLVAFDRKRLEAALVQVSASDAKLGALPPLGVHGGHALHEPGTIGVVFRP